MNNNLDEDFDEFLKFEDLYGDQDNLNHNNILTLDSCINKITINARFLPKDFLKVKEIMMEVVKNDIFALYYASDTLKNNRDLVLESVKNNGLSLCWASEDLRSDEEIVLEAVKQDGYSFQYANENLKKDKNIVIMCAEANNWSVIYADENLQKDKDVLLKVSSNYVLDYLESKKKPLFSMYVNQ